MERDGHKCRNCGDEKELVVHHWRPIASESEGITMWGYRKAKCPLIVPESGLVTVCVICHGSLTSGRDRVRIRDDISQLGPVSVPERDWHNIFELWDTNDRKLPLKVVRQTWNQGADHYTLVERIEVRNWPYGYAWGRYFRNGKLEDEQKIASAGSYQWRKLSE
jgi:hypothetical protein